MNIDSAVANVVSQAVAKRAYKATQYLDPRTVVKATRRHRLDRRAKREEFVVTIGTPNYEERAFIKKAPFAVGDGEVWFKFYPNKK